MLITRIAVFNFRGYQDLRLTFEKGLNILVGNNGMGKTNLVEAIAFLSLARSFRTNDEKEIRKKGEPFARLQGTFLSGTRKSEIAMRLFAKGKTITINKNQISRISELISESHVIVFKPQDVFMFDDSPAVRRRFLDAEISHHSSKYLNSLKRYEKILLERNKLLKEENVDLLQLESLTTLLVETASDITRRRNAFLNKLRPFVKKVADQLTNQEKHYDFIYEPFIDIDLVESLDQIENAFKKALDADLRYHMTTIGPHREDFSCMLNGAKISESGSQGEKRLGALILKLALYEMEEDSTQKPIVILDDVLSELDEEHQKRLLDILDNYEQVFITTTEWKKDRNATVYDVADHKVTRRNIYGG